MDKEGGPTTQQAGISVPRQNLRARAKAIRKSAYVEEVIDDTDEDDEINGKSLSVKDGKLGFITSKGFQSATNFIVDIASMVYSKKYSIKGNSILT